MLCICTGDNIKIYIMKVLNRIKAVATPDDFYMIYIDFESVINSYNNHSMKNYTPIIKMLNNDTKSILRRIQSETHKKFGASGMVLISQILPALNLQANHKILD